MLTPRATLPLDGGNRELILDVKISDWCVKMGWEERVIGLNGVGRRFSSETVREQETRQGWYVC